MDDDDDTAFTEAIHTSDIIGNPDDKFGHVDIFVNGGRLQPGCYSNTLDVNQRKLNDVLSSFQSLFNFNFQLGMP